MFGAIGDFPTNRNGRQSGLYCGDSTQHVSIQDETGKLTFEYGIGFPVNPDPDQPFFPFAVNNSRRGNQPITGFNGFYEFYVGGTQDDMGMIDRYHGRVIGQPENKSAMGQFMVIDSHFRTGHHLHPADAVSGFKRHAAKMSVN